MVWRRTASGWFASACAWAQRDFQELRRVANDPEQIRLMVEFGDWISYERPRLVEIGAGAALVAVSARVAGGVRSTGRGRLALVVGSPYHQP